MDERRQSPERHRNVDAKVTTINPYAKLLSTRVGGVVSQSVSLREDSPQKLRGLSPNKSPPRAGDIQLSNTMYFTVQEGRMQSPGKSPNKSPVRAEYYNESMVSYVVPIAREKWPLL